MGVGQQGEDSRRRDCDHAVLRAREGDHRADVDPRGEGAPTDVLVVEAAVVVDSKLRAARPANLEVQRGWHGAPRDRPDSVNHAVEHIDLVVREVILG